MEERRTRPRWQATFFFDGEKTYDRQYLDVVDRKTKESIGHLVDLTIDGLQLISDQEIPPGTVIEMRVDLPTEVHRIRQILITAESVWSRRDSRPGIAHTGFRIVSITPPYAEVIDMLIR